MAVTITKITNGSVSDAIKKTVKDSNLALGAEIASQAKVLAPVDLGQLRNSISASNLSQTVLLNDKDGEKADALETTGLKDGEVYVGSNSDHALFQEYGTIKQPAQPFLRPSAELKAKGANVADIVKTYNAKAMKEELKQRKTTVKNYG
jgi:HK97 gp10 family phage protein